MSIVSLPELKNYLGLTGTHDDQLLSAVILAAEDRLERDTGRVFAYTSNVRREYSTDGQALVAIRDIPAQGSNTRTVQLNGATLEQGVSYWALPDRRNPDVSVQLQIRPFDTSSRGWWMASPNWFDANMDSPRYWASIGTPLDLVIVGAEGHANPPEDVVGMAKAVAGLMYWQAKAGSSGTLTTTTGEIIDLEARDPIGYAEFVQHWRTRTAVSGV